MRLGCHDGVDSITHYVHHCAFLWPHVEVAAGAPPIASVAGRLCLQEVCYIRYASFVAAFTVYDTIRATSRASMEALSWAVGVI